MQHVDITAIVIVAVAVAALLVFMIVRNKKDRKKLFKPGSTDPVEEQVTEQQRRKDKS